MPVFWIALGTLWGVTLVTEVSLWFLFSRNIRQMLMPPELDESSFGLFTLGRVRVFAILHTITLLALFTGFLFWAW